MRKSFTRLFSLVMFLALFSSVSMAANVVPTKTSPVDTEAKKAWTKTTDKVEITYTAAVAAGTVGNVRLTDLTNSNALLAILQPTDSRITYDGNKVIIDFSASLKELTKYQIEVTAGAFKVGTEDVTGVVSFNFTTGDYTAPTIKTLTPATGTTLVNNTANQNPALTIEFKDDSGLAKGTTGNVAIYKADGNLWDLIPVSDTSFDAATKTLTVPASAVRTLEDNTNYVVTVDAGVVVEAASKRADNVVNKFAGLTNRTVWTFTTPKFSVVNFAANYPKAGTVAATEATVLVKTDAVGKVYALIASSVPASPAALKSDASTKSVTVAAAGTEYSIKFTGLFASTAQDVYLVSENSEGILGAVTAPVSFTTLSNTAPLLAAGAGNAVQYKVKDAVKATATRGASSIAFNSSTESPVLQPASSINTKTSAFVLTFDKKMAIKTGNLLVKKTVDNSVAVTVAASAMSLSTDKYSVTVPISGLANNTEYYVTIPNTLFADTDGNKFAGFATTDYWVFQTNDSAIPAYTSKPANGDVGVVKTTKTIVLTFDKDMAANTGFTIGGVWNGTSPTESPFELKINGVASAFTSTVAANVITITNVGGAGTAFPSSAVVSLQIKKNALKDVNGNVYNADGLAQGIYFVMADYEGPYITKWTNANDEVITDMSVNDKVVINFNEPIFLLGGGAITNNNVSDLLTVKKDDVNGASIPYTAVFDSNKNTITITPSSPWTSGNTYYFAITTDIEDATHMGYSGGASFNEKTIAVTDITPATVTINKADKPDVDPATPGITMEFKKGANPDIRTSVLDASANYVAYATAADLENLIVFKEGNASGADVAFTVAEIGNASKFNITPSADLKGNTTYYVGIGASTTGDNDIANVAKFVTFTTFSNDVPEMVSSVPAKDAVQVAKTLNKIEITFNTNITYNTGDVTVNDGSNNQTIPPTATGKVLTISGVTLATDKTYTVTVPVSMVQNSKDSSKKNALFSFSFQTSDTKLDVTAKAFNGVGGRDIDFKPKITFGEKNVTKKSGKRIEIRKVSTLGLVEAIDLSSDQIEMKEVGGVSVATITPSALFSYGVEYYIEVPAGAFADKYGNGNKAITGTTSGGTDSYTFTTDDPALAIEKISPANGTDKALVTAPIVITFNREIAKNSGSVGFITVKGSAAPQPTAYEVTSSNVTVSGKTLTITHPEKAFTADAEIYVYLQADALKAVNNISKKNAVVDNNSTPKFFFNTGDVNAPVPTFNPGDFVETDVYTPVNSTVTVTFDKDVKMADGTAITSSKMATIFTFKKGGSTNVSFAGTISGRVITLTPVADLEELTDYTVSLIDNAIHGVNDAPIPAASTAFKTIDTKAPVIASVTPTAANNAVSFVSATLADKSDATFYYLCREKSTDAAPTAAAIKAADNKIIVTTIGGSAKGVGAINISELKSHADYQFFFYAVDNKGNATEVGVTEFTTKDNVAPLLVSSNPASGAVDVDTPVEITLTFNEKVVAGGGTDNIIVRDFATQAIVKTYSSNTDIAAVSTDDKSLKLTLTGLVGATDPAKKFVVELAAASVKDKASTANDFAGVFGANGIVFTTEDNQKPTILSNTTGNVDANAPITMTFSENVKAGTGTIILSEDTDGNGTYTAAEAIQVFPASQATIDGKTVSIRATAPFKSGKNYQVTVNASFVKDLSSNANGNALATFVFTGKTTDMLTVTEVKVGSTTVLDKAKVAINDMAAIKVTFNKDAYLQVGGFHKALMLLSQEELLSCVSLKDAEGTSIAITKVEKDGNTITIKTSADSYSELTKYTLVVKNFSNLSSDVMATYTATYETMVATTPVATFLPANNAKKIDPMSHLTITFDRDIYAAVVQESGKPIAYAYIDNSNVKSFVSLTQGGLPVEFTATISGKVITVVPSAKLKSNKPYVLTLSKDVVDADNNKLLAGTNSTFTTADYSLPVIASFGPNTTSTAKDAGMWVTFDKDVTVSTGSVVIRREDGTVFQTISAEGLSIDAGNKAKLKIAHRDFEPFTNYFVELGAGVVVDASGNANALFNEPTLENEGWLFTTSGTYELQAQLSPTGENTTTPVVLTMEFSNAPAGDKGEIGKFISVYKEDGTAIYQVEASTLNAFNKKVTIQGAANLFEPNQKYYVRVEPGAFKSTTGNKYAGIVDNSWSFSTINSIAPKVTALSPADNAEGVELSTAFTATFDRDIVLGSGMIAVRYANGALFEEVNVSSAVVAGKTLTFNLTKQLDSNTAYYVIVPAGAVTNTTVTKDAFTGINNVYTWNFTTIVDKTAPKALTYSPDATTVLTETDPTYVITFDEDLVFGAGSLKIYKKADATLALTIPVTASMVSGKTVTVKNTYNAETNNGLATSTEYYVLYEEGLVKDAAGNLAAALTDATAWTFKTGDTYPTTDKSAVNKTEFKVYPNPFESNVTLDNATTLTKVVITNIAGVNVKVVAQPQSDIINLSELRSGIYFISLYQGNTVIKTVKVSKK